MTLNAIYDAVNAFAKLYIDNDEVEVIFLDELTETIEVRFIERGFVTFVTKSSLSLCKVHQQKINLGDNLVLRYRGDNYV